MYTFSPKKFRKKDGSLINIIVVIGDDVDTTYQYKEEMKNFGARWIGSVKTWGWYMSQDSQKNKIIINNMVKPAIEFLKSKEQNIEDEGQTIEEILDELLHALSTEDTQEEIDADANVYMTQDEIKDKIYSFKASLVNAVSSEEFKKLLEPIIKARQAQGHQFSFINTILIWVQDKRATMVKSKGDWAKMNREVKPGSPAIALWVPMGGQMFKNKDEKERAKAEWLSSRGFSSENELTPGEREMLRHHINANTGTKFSLVHSFYDVRFTQQMEGKEDIVGDPNADIPWYNKGGKETMAVKEKIESFLEVVKDSGVDVSKTKHLGGALGVSKGGRIEVLDGAQIEPNYLMTLVHEFAHEMLHQTYLKSQNTEFGQFYVGREGGRGPVEQQAELTAWVVCKFYGYDLKEAVNYMGIWGMNEKNAVKAFNIVAKTADFIINKTNNKIKARREMLGESKEFINEVNFSGWDIAKMCGPDAEKAYQNSLQQIQQDEQEQEAITENFKQFIERLNKC